MDTLKNAIKNRKGKILNISIELGGDEDEKELEELGLAPEVKDVDGEEKEILENEVGGPGLEQGDEGEEVAELETKPTSQQVAASMLEGNEGMNEHAPRTLAGKVKSKMMEVMNKGKK